MFTGIIRGVGKVAEISLNKGTLSYAIELPSELAEGLAIGASVSIDGVCQTIARFEGNKVWFDAIPETLRRTTLSEYTVGRSVHIERAAKIGDEIGGHLLSGHIFGTGEVEKLIKQEGECILWIRCPAFWMKYFFPKGFIALDGASLTVVNIDPSGRFSVHLIPETLRATTFASKQKGDHLNVELDAQTQTIVDTLERINGHVQ